MSTIRLIYYGFWIAQPALLAVIGTAMVRRKLTATLPVFSAYTVFELVRTCALLWLALTGPHHGVGYAQVFWMTELVDVALSFSVLRELYREFFREYEGLRRLGTLLFRWCAVVLLAVATVLALTGPANGPHIAKTLLVIDRSVAFLQTGLLLVLFVFASYFGLGWRKVVFGIAAGFGLYGSMQLATVTIQSHFGATNAALALIEVGSYDCALLIWLSYLLAPKKVSSKPIARVTSTELEDWNHALVRYMQR